MTRIVAVSDTHMYHEKLVIPDGDILVHAGDMTRSGKLGEVAMVGEWLNSQPHKHIVVIAGNHDWAFERAPDVAPRLLGRATYLRDSGANILGLNFWGSPWQPWFWDWAFNLPRGDALKAKWDLIPTNTDVLVTHGPPYGYGDLVNGESVGCIDLLNALDRVRPRVHIYGHIHEGYGRYTNKGILLANASIMDGTYSTLNKPTVIDLEN